jgi:TRAP transporter TAXI family solute receptor
MKWASLPLLAVVLSLPSWDGVISQTLPPRDQIRQRVNDNVLFLMGGQPGATFSQLAHDISVVVEDGNNLRVLPVVGGAAVQNVEDVLYLRSIDMALTTQEAMNHLKSTGELGPHLEQQLTYIATLFPNPLQILARAGAKSITDLSGKKVNFNNKGSATAQFVPKIFKTLGIDVQELYMAQGDAMEKLRSGEIDATICSCPTPVPAFANVKPDWGLRFVTVPYEKSLQATYLPASISNEDYPTLVEKEVETIAAITVLVSYNWPKDSIRYKRTEKFVDAFFSKFGEFHKPPRHPLWKTVNLAATIPGWTRFPAAEEWLRNWRAGQAKGQEADFKQFMSGQTAKPSTEQADQLFREFMIWRSKGK